MAAQLCHPDVGQSGKEAGAGSALQIEAVVNPLSKAAQRLAPILEWLRASFDASIKVEILQCAHIAFVWENLLQYAMYAYFRVKAASRTAIESPFVISKPRHSTKKQAGSQQEQRLIIQA